MELIENKYINYIEYNWNRLKELPKLSIKDIFIFKEPYKMVLLFYYDYSKVYKKIYTIEQLNKKINEWEYTLYLLMIYISNIKALKYLNSQGVNIYYYNKFNNSYSLAILKNNIKIIKYLDSQGLNINNEYSRKTIFYLIWYKTNSINISLSYIFKNQKYKLNKYKMRLYI